MPWLFKEEPTHYGYDALVKDGRTQWSGVRNPLAQKHLHGVKKGDRIFYYHTGDEKSVVAIARALGDAYADPADPTGKTAVVDVGPVQKLPRPVTLAEIKADPKIGFALPGAYPLMQGDMLLGAIAVSGGSSPEKDDSCARAALAKASAKLR